MLAKPIVCSDTAKDGLDEEYALPVMSAQVNVCLKQEHT